METKRIAITEDQFLLAEGIERILQDRPEYTVVGKVSNGLELLQLINGTNVDLVLLDIHMPKMDGLRTAAYIKQTHPAIKIILVSICYDKKVKQQMHEIGVEGFISKTVSADDFLSAIHQIVWNNKIITMPSEPEEEASDKHLLLAQTYKLTITETAVIRLIVKGKSSKQIAAERKLSIYTVETHRKNIFKKLKVGNMAELVAYAAQNGI